MAGKPKYDIAEYIGQSLGRWTVLTMGAKTSRGAVRWVCRCICGRERQVMATRLVRGQTNGCPSCSRQSRDQDCQWPFTIYVIKKLRYDALKRGIEWNVTEQQLADLWRRQDSRCALTGLELNFRSRQGEDQLASLDRIDSSQGYVVGNVQWVHKDINRMKNAFDQNHFINMCRLVANSQEERVF